MGQISTLCWGIPYINRLSHSNFLFQTQRFNKRRFTCWSIISLKIEIIDKKVIKFDRQHWCDKEMHFRKDDHSLDVSYLQQPKQTYWGFNSKQVQSCYSRQHWNTHIRDIKSAINCFFQTWDSYSKYFIIKNLILVAG